MKIKISSYINTKIFKKNESDPQQIRVQDSIEIKCKLYFLYFDSLGFLFPFQILDLRKC
jgi:hypothetical protein